MEPTALAPTCVTWGPMLSGTVSGASGLGLTLPPQLANSLKLLGKYTGTDVTFLPCSKLKNLEKVWFPYLKDKTPHYAIYLFVFLFSCNSHTCR